jgi:plasmid stabilization system protein ParE
MILRWQCDGSPGTIPRPQEHCEPELAEEPHRFIMLTGFPYVIVYNADRNPPLILRVLHGARDLPIILRNL